MARKAGQGKEEEESRARQQKEKTPVRDEEKTPACDGQGHHVVEQGLWVLLGPPGPMKSGVLLGPLVPISSDYTCVLLVQWRLGAPGSFWSGGYRVLLGPRWVTWAALKWRQGPLSFLDSPKRKDNSKPPDRNPSPHTWGRYLSTCRVLNPLRPLARSRVSAPAAADATLVQRGITTTTRGSFSYHALLESLLVEGRVEAGGPKPNQAAAYMEA
ncbi:hypothetical protein STEG23_000457 [Scotinomys teguina]